MLPAPARLQVVSLIKPVRSLERDPSQSCRTVVSPGLAPDVWSSLEDNLTMLPDHADFVIGVDTHKDTHTAVIVAASGAVLSTLTFAAARRGYQRVVVLANRVAQGRRLWALEKGGSFGAGLATHLQASGEKVVEIDRPKRPARRNGSKSDELDAERGARGVQPKIPGKPAPAETTTESSCAYW